MNNRFLISLTLAMGTTLTIPMAFADASQACQQYYKQDKQAFLNTLQANPTTVHENINQCVQANSCSTAQGQDRVLCMQRLHLYDYLATTAANQPSQVQDHDSFGDTQSQPADNTQSQPQPQQAAPKSSYDFSYKAPMSRPQDNGYAPVTDQQTNSPQQNIYKNINF